MPNTVTVNGSVEVIEVTRDQYTVQTDVAPVQVVTVGIQGPQGPQGPPGPGGGGAGFVWDQGTPSTVWTITHTLNKYPSVTVVDSGNNVVIGEVSYTDITHLTVTFSVAMGGFAYLN